MNAITLESETGITRDELKSSLYKSLEGRGLKKVLLIPPDYTRMYSGAGLITAMYYDMLKSFCRVDIMPAVGTHDPMSETEWRAFFGDGVPFSSMINHNWRKDVVKIGKVPSGFIEEISEGLIKNAIDVEINKNLLDTSYDLIISIGQVVPHEIAGMANHSKNIFVGCGGHSMISQTHILGAVYGMERIMGREHSPVRKVFDFAEQRMIGMLPLLYVLTVTTRKDTAAVIHGLYIGRDRALFEAASALSQKMNITYLDQPVKKILVWLDAKEFKSTWLGNKSIYRTRMAIADGGELVILAPGVKKFGEDLENDRLIRKYGYVGIAKVMALCEEHEELRNNLSVAAHLIHGSSEGRFTITYCTKELSKPEIEKAGFNYLPFDKVMAEYGVSPQGIPAQKGNLLFIDNPAVGLWMYRRG